MQHLRHALESEQDPEEKTVVMKGPLSEVYTNALAIAYAKEDPVTGKPSLESQEMDVAYLKKLAEQVVPQDEQTDQSETIYGVNVAELDAQEVVNVTQQMTDYTTKNNTDDFVLIIDGTQPGSGGDTGGEIEPRVLNLSQGLESFAAAIGIKVFHSLTEYARQR